MSGHKVPTPPPQHFSTTPLTTENGRGARFVSPTAMQELKARGGILQGAVNGNGSSAMPQQPAMKRRTRALVLELRQLCEQVANSEVSAGWEESLTAVEAAATDYAAAEGEAEAARSVLKAALQRAEAAENVASATHKVGLYIYSTVYMALPHQRPRTSTLI